MSPRYIHHVILTTGHVRRSPRSEVRNDVLMLRQELLRRALDSPSGTHVPIDTLPCTLTANTSGSALLATIWGAPIEQHGAAPYRVPLVTMGVATRGRHSRKLWQILHEGRAEVATDSSRPPPVPWCAAVREPSTPLAAELLPVIPDLERDFAWAWIGMRYRASADICRGGTVRA